MTDTKYVFAYFWYILAIIMGVISGIAGLYIYIFYHLMPTLNIIACIVGGMVGIRGIYLEIKWRRLDAEDL